MPRKIEVGSKVALTGRFLKSTGQHTSPDAHKKWTVIYIDKSGMFVNVDEPRDWHEWYTQEEFDAMSDEDKLIVSHKRFHIGNLYVVGTLDVRNAD